MDPNFIALAILEGNRQHFSPLAQGLHPHTALLQSCVDFNILPLCDVDYKCDPVVVRLNDSKVLSWLNAKVDRTKATSLETIINTNEVLFSPSPRKALFFL